MATRLILAVGVMLPLIAWPQESSDEAIKTAAEAAPLPPALRDQINAALRVRDLTHAETLLVEEIGRNPKSPRLLALLGSIFFLDGKYPNSIVALKKAEKLAPLEESSRFTLAMGYVLIKRRDWARQELQKLASDFPGAPLYPYWLARFDYDDQKFPAAAERLRAVLALDPEFMKAYDKLGLCLEALGQFDQAIETYKQAIELNRRKMPRWAWPPLNLGTLLQKLGRFEEAEGYLREAVQSDPNLATAHYQLGVVLERQKKTAEAVEELTRASVLDPQYPEPFYALGRLYRDLGDTERARQALARFDQLRKTRKKPRELNPRRPRGFRLRIRSLWLRLGKHERP
jgi:tetratricopeptide (TPR) repeat protein